MEPNLSELQNLQTLIEKGNFSLAESKIKSLLEKYKDSEPLESLLGMALINQKKYEESIDVFKKLVKRNPKNFFALNNLSVSLMQTDKTKEAVESFKQILLINPKSVLTHYNLASLYMRIERYEEAINHFKRSIELDSNYYKAYVNLGLVYKKKIQFDKAKIQFNKALVIDPNNIASYINLGNIFLETKDYKNAISHYDKALQIDPNLPTIYVNLATIFLDIRNFKKAIQYREIALKLDYKSPGTFSNYLFDLQYVENFDPNFYLEKVKKYTSSIVPIDKESINKYQYEVNPKKLRVGFVSGDLRSHPGGFFLLNTIRNLKGKNLELYAYSNYDSSDEITKEFKSIFSVWHSIEFKNDLEVINQVRKDGIHILIDCMGHTKDNRLTIFPYKPAPIQLTYLAPGSTGIPEIDYFLGSSHLIPKHEENHFVEKIWRLPEVLQCFTPPNFDLEVKELPALKNGYITFGSLNKFSKLSDSALKLWSEVLTSIENSKILIKLLQFEYQGIKDRIIKQFERNGVKPNRIIFTERTEHRDQALELYNSIDICLDTFPFQGNTTTLEAAWMGVPTLTMKGDRFIFHFGEANNANMELSEWIAENQKDFIIRAIKFSSDLKQLSELRQRLRDQLLKSPICDAPRLANHFDKMLWKMWKNYNGT